MHLSFIIWLVPCLCNTFSWLTQYIPRKSRLKKYSQFDALELSKDTLYKIHLGQSSEYTYVSPKAELENHHFAHKSMGRQAAKQIIWSSTAFEKVCRRVLKGRPFIVQQGIRLLKYNGRNMDLRLLMTKNGQGIWEALQHHCRVAEND